MDSILGAVARPSSRETTRLSTTSGEGRHLLDVEALGEIGPILDVDLAHAEPPALLARDVREQAFHPAGRSRAPGCEEHEQRTISLGQSSLLAWSERTTDERHARLRFRHGFVVLDRRERRSRRGGGRAVLELRRNGEPR